MKNISINQLIVNLESNTDPSYGLNISGVK